MRVGKNHVSELCRNETVGYISNGFSRLFNRADLSSSLLYILDTIETKCPTIQHQGLIKHWGYLSCNPLYINDLEKKKENKENICFLYKKNVFFFCLVGGIYG